MNQKMFEKGEIVFDSASNRVNIERHKIHGKKFRNMKLKNFVETVSLLSE